MELFTIIYEPDKIIYKDTNKNRYTKSFDRDPIWLGEINTAKKYGKYIHKFRTKKELERYYKIFVFKKLSRINRFIN